MKEAPFAPPPTHVLDGTRIHLAWREGNTLHERHAWSAGETRGVSRALAMSGLTLAGCVDSEAILDGVGQLRL